jgi:hypothetical protein
LIKKRTVLVLGAGASGHFGYPIGLELLNQVVQTTDPQNEEALQFKHRLSRSGYYSVDAFLEHNREFLAIGKLLIADCLKRREVPDRLFAPNNPGWYQYFFNCLLGERPDDIAQNQVTIITFNYDRSIEYYLHESIANRYNASSVNALRLLRTIPIIHVHGILGEYPEVPYSPRPNQDTLESICQKIQIVHELTDNTNDFCTTEFRKAHDALASAERIFFLGFGFYEDNVRRFRFFTPEVFEKREVFATIHGLYEIRRRSLMQRLDKYGFGKATCQACTCQELFERIAELE